MSDADLKKAFQEYVKGAAGGKQLSAADLEWANDKAISKMVKECIPQCKTHSEASVFPKLMNKTTKKLSCEAFVKEYFPNLAKLAVETKTKERNVPLDDPRVVEESDKLKAAVIKKCNEPKAGGGKSAAVVDRLTDTSKYTGAHKERFDESGKGKGASGRKDEVKNTGYVGNYKGEGTYEKK